MAVPSGSYELTASLDLSPVFGVIASSHRIEVNVPGPGILDEQLKKLESGEPNVRRQAVYDLRYFKTDAARVVPALLARLEDADESVRAGVMSVLMGYPKEAAAQVDAFLKILADGGSREQLMAFQLVARHGPADRAVLEALEKALAEAPENYKLAYGSSLERYRMRTAPK